MDKKEEFVDRAGAFHTHDGWEWERQEDGSVKVTAPGTLEPHILDASSWASVVSHVSARGENSDTYQKALDFHQVG